MGSTTARHLSPPIELRPDRLLPADPGTRTIARRLYEQVRDLPVIAPHGHVDPALLLNDRPFPDPAILLVTPDHCVTRLLHADGAARHDMSRRIDAGFLVRLVAEHRLGEPEAADIAVHLVSGQPKAVCKL